MRNKEEILDEHDNNDTVQGVGNYCQRHVALNAMDEYAEQVAKEFLEWAEEEGWENYDGHDRWISQYNNNRVVETKGLFMLFKNSQCW